MSIASFTANRGTAAVFPGQAILMSKTIEIFETTGSELEASGNFFALMFLVLGLGSLFSYFLIGWSSNVVAQVCHVMHAA